MDSNMHKEIVAQQPKKCYCARCFMPIDGNDKIDVDGQNFHKCCCMCCVCQQIPRSIKMFNGHVFCTECFNSQVKSRFRGEGPRMQSNSWWMQWAPNVTATSAPHVTDSKGKDLEGLEDNQPPKEPVKKCICSRCLQAVDGDSKVTIGDQHFHTHCARCYCCHCVPTGNIKIYYGQLFCEECFHRHVMPRNKDNPSEFFRYCFDQWQNNSQVADNMRDFMNNSGNSSERPMIFVPQGCTQSFCRCGNAKDWFSKPEQAKKSNDYEEDSESILDIWDLDPCESIVGLHDLKESAKLVNFNVAEKIEKLTKLIHNKSSEKCPKKWKNFEQSTNYCFSMSLDPSLYGWVDLQQPIKERNEKLCPKCLWQCGPTFVSSDYLKNVVVNCVEFYAE